MARAAVRLHARAGVRGRVHRVPGVLRRTDHQTVSAGQERSHRSVTGEAEEVATLRLLRENLREEVAGFDEWIGARAETGIPYLTRIYEKEWDGVPLDSLPLLGTAYFNFQPFDATYQGLKSSGNLDLIESAELRAKVIDYYEREHVHLADWSSWHKNFVTNTLEPYMFDELYIDPQELVSDVDHLKRQLDTRHLNSLISTQIGSLRRLAVEIEGARGHAEEIVGLIDEELDGG